MNLIIKSKIYNNSPQELQNILNISNSLSDVLRKIGMSTCRGNYVTLNRIIKEYELCKDKLNENRKILNVELAKNTNKKVKIGLNKILVENTSYTNMSSLKRRIINENLKENKCEVCGLTEWNGKEISLQIHHKNGIRSDCRLDNLQILCPNCHSQTENYAGKNITDN